MRSKHICAFASASVIAMGGTARADVTRLRISIEELPRQDTPIKLEPKNAVLPNGARELGPVPKSWQAVSDSDDIEASRCTDNRQGSVGTIFSYSGATQTRRIWEANGKVWLDSADVETKTGFINVRDAERVPLARITDGVWGYRRQKEVVVVAARDVGVMDHGAFFECRIADQTISAPAGTAMIESSPQEVNAVMRQVAQWHAEPGKPPKWRPAWTGVELHAMASISRSSADPAPMLNLVLRSP